MEKTLAKSITNSGKEIDSISHGKSVGKANEVLCQEIISKQLDSHETQKLILTAKLSGALHDIGKIQEELQKVYSGKKLKGEKSKNKFRHNEIGWAFLATYLKNNDSFYYDAVLNSVYWHHGISNKMGTNTSWEILQTISEEYILKMKEFLIEIVGIDFLRETNNDAIKTPSYFYVEGDGKNELNFFIRSCLLFSDRLVSKIEGVKQNSNISKEEIQSGIIEEISKSSILINESPYKSAIGIQRFVNQQEISTATENTIIANAPGGFGKTLAALLKILASKKRGMWVCPRNSVAINVYFTILRELKNLKVDLKIELFLTGEVILKNHNEEVSDIIITNIDNFLQPSIDSSNLEKTFFINNSIVVFDEYHELICDSALYSLFVIIMRVRHRYIDSETILISATGSGPVYKKWDTNINKTKILPEEGVHYPAQHKKLYNATVEEVDEFPGPDPTSLSSLCVFNSLKESQIEKLKSPNNFLIHGKFEDEVKKEKILHLLDLYGPNGRRDVSFSPVVSTHIIEASMDVSFRTTYDIIVSPEGTGQRLPRTNRFGDIDEVCDFKIMKLKNNKSEAQMRNIRYNEDLAMKWFNFCYKNMHGKLITLDEFYVYYNAFNKLYETEIKAHQDSLYMQSLKLLSEIYPITYIKKTQKKRTKAGGNKFRTKGKEIFVIMRKLTKDGSIAYCDPISFQYYKSISEDFDEGRISNIDTALEKVCKLLKDDPRFEYGALLEKTKYFKGSFRDLLKEEGRYRDTPYIRFDMVYYDGVGPINEQTILEYLKNNK